MAPSGTEAEGAAKHAGATLSAQLALLYFISGAGFPKSFLTDGCVSSLVFYVATTKGTFAKVVFRSTEGAKSAEAD